jgi:hypothetical protein
MILSLYLAAVLAAATPDFEVQTLDGQTAAGALAELSAGRLAIETADGRKEFDLAALASVTRRETRAAAPEGAIQIELLDRSQLVATGYAVANGTAQATLADGRRIELATRAIHTVRFAGSDVNDAKLAKQWSEIVETASSGDVLVIRKAGTLDYLEGAAGDITDENCKFKIDDDMARLKRANVEGVIYFHPAAAELPESIGFATSADGSRLAVRSASLADGSVKVVTPGGIEVALPVESVTRLDFSSGKIVFLSDLDPDSAAYVPLVGFKDDVPAVQEFYRYRRDRSFDKGPLRLDGKTYRKGLALASRTVLSYKLPGKFRTLRAVAGIDDGVRPSGSVRLVIKGDGKTLWQGDVRGAEPAKELEVEIGGVKRLELVADYGDDIDIGDRLDLCEARVTK